MNKMDRMFFDTDFFTSKKEEEISFFGRDTSEKITKFKSKSVKAFFNKDFVCTTPLSFSGKKIGLDTNFRTQEFYPSKPKLIELLRPVETRRSFGILKLF